MNTAFAIRRLAPDDLPAAFGLSCDSGWNQLQDDWQRLLLYQPDGCFVAETVSPADSDSPAKPTLVGTVTTTSYGTDLAWIGMMLVDRRFRRRGLATSLMQAALTHLDKTGVKCVKLDATPAGQGLYQKLGFKNETAFSRMRRSDANPKDHPYAKPSSEVPALEYSTQLSEEHLAMDRGAFGADRSRWLLGLANASSIVATSRGFGMLRPGYRADYIGPIVAERVEEAHAIFSALTRLSTAEQTFCDLIDPDLACEAESIGFVPVRTLTRMSTAELHASPKDAAQYAIGDPATG